MSISCNVANSRSLSRFPPITFHARKRPYERALGDNRTHHEELSRHANHLPSFSGKSVNFRLDGICIAFSLLSIYLLFLPHPNTALKRPNPNEILPHSIHATNTTDIRRLQPTRDGVPRNTPGTSSLASLDSGFVEIGFVQLSQSVG